MDKKDVMKMSLQELLNKIEKEVKPIEKKANIAYWNASISGSEKDFGVYEKSMIELMEIYSDSSLFSELDKIKESALITDPFLSRQLELVYNEFLKNQIDKDLLKKKINLESAIEQKYANFRVVVDGDTLTDNEVEDELSTSKNLARLKSLWDAHKQIGLEVEGDLKEIVSIRNEIAVSLGFRHYQEMSLLLDDQNPEDLDVLFDELDVLTRDTYMSLKDDIDAYLSKKLNISKAELMPWHYENRYFQEAPKIYDVDLDDYYKEKNLEKITTDYFSSIGLPIESIIGNSDLYEKKGKNQHAYCIDMDREGDIRILCNIKSDSYWMNTMLHEFGHGVYDLYHDQTLPFYLREPAHTFTTEAIAMLFGRMGSDADWMVENGLLGEGEKERLGALCFKDLKLQQLVFSRWVQVLYRFEKGMYSNPDQDLNQLWWDLVENYQMIKKPEGRDMPDYATKIHVAAYPCYYHNYMLGELLASQLYNYINTTIVDNKNVGFYNQKKVGEYLKENIFKPGNRWYWNEMIERATGEKLTAKYYANQFIE